MFGRDVFQYRVFTIPIHQETRDHETLVSKVASDVGAECTHPELSRWHKHRWWGLLICAHPCFNGITRLSDVGASEWYDDKARALVRQMASDDPSLRDEFANRVLKHRDSEYWKAFVARVKSKREEAT
jgi:hypothetical protein